MHVVATAPAVVTQSPVRAGMRAAASVPAVIADVFSALAVLPMAAAVVFTAGFAVWNTGTLSVPANAPAAPSESIVCACAEPIDRNKAIQIAIFFIIAP